MIKRDYNALKKCLIQDYPYDFHWNDDIYYLVFESVYNIILSDHSKINESYYSNEDGGIIRLDFLDHYVILCHRYAHQLWKEGLNEAADVVYYSLRVRCSIDLFYRTEFGECLIPVHAIGSIIDSHAKYGKYFSFYNGVHIGPYSIAGLKPSEWKHPIIGDYVTLLADSKVYGRTVIGNNVIVAAGTTLINAKVPDNCIVSGHSPELYFMPLAKSNEDMYKK